MHVPRILPASIRRAFALMRARFLQIFADAPVLFFGVVLGVALLFRVGVGIAREAASPTVVAPTFVTGAEPRGAASADTRLHADPGATPLPAATTSAERPAAEPNAELGAAARVQPIGSPSPSAPLPARVRPKPRGHGRRPLR